MEKKTEEKAPVKLGFFKKKIEAFKAIRKMKRLEKDSALLLKLSKQAGLTLVKIVVRGNAHYIQAPSGQLLRIGSGRK